MTVVTDTNETPQLKAGDSIIELVETWHYGKNEVKEPAVIIVFYAGVRGTSINVTKRNRAREKATKK
ncbi:MAG: hypothetical protein ACFCD0_15580 [Gemmataceae bacterium]